MWCIQKSQKNQLNARDRSKPPKFLKATDAVIPTKAPAYIPTKAPAYMKRCYIKPANARTFARSYVETSPASLVKLVPQSHGRIIYVPGGYHHSTTSSPFVHSYLPPTYQPLVPTSRSMGASFQRPLLFKRPIMKGPRMLTMVRPLKAPPQSSVVTTPLMRRMRKTPREFFPMESSKKPSPFAELAQDSFLNRNVLIELAMIRSRNEAMLSSEQPLKKEEALLAKYPAFKDILFDNMQMYYFLVYNHRDRADLGSNQKEKLQAFRKKIIQELFEAAKKNGYAVQQESLLEKHVIAWYKTKMNETIAQLKEFEGNDELEESLRNILRKVKTSDEYKEDARNDSVQTETESKPPESPPQTTGAENKRGINHVSDASDESIASESTFTEEPRTKRARYFKNQVVSRVASEDEASVTTQKHSNLSGASKSCSGLEMLWQAQEIQRRKH